MNEIQDEILDIEQLLLTEGLDAEDAVVWYRARFSYDDIVTCLDIGITDPDTAFALRALNIEPDLVKNVRAARINHRTNGPIDLKKGLDELTEER